MITRTALLSLFALQLFSAPGSASLSLAPQDVEQGAADLVATDALAGTIWIVPPAQGGLFLAVEFPDDLSGQALVTMPQLGVRRPMMIERNTDRSGLSLNLPDSAGATLKIEIDP